MVLGAIFCLGMGLWQLSRYQSVSGNVQNLGYTFMWPFLAGFLVYAYLKYIRLEAENDAGAGAGETPDGDDDEDAVPARGARADRAPRSHRRGRDTATEIPADILPTRRSAPADTTHDEGLRAYNEYLADLDRQDRRAGDRPQEKPAS